MGEVKYRITEPEIRAFLPDEVRAALRLGTPDEVALVVRASGKRGRLYVAQRIRPRNGHALTYQLARKVEDFLLDTEPRAWTAATYFNVPCVRLPSLILCRAAVVSERGRLIAHPHIRGPIAPKQGTPLTEEQADEWEDYVTAWPWTVTTEDGYERTYREVSETAANTHRA